MLNSQIFFEYLKGKGVSFSTGVPDSLLKDFCAYAYDHGNDIIAANEGGAISLAAGHYLATGRIPLVYMQNSGFGNAINPITSLIDPEVYAIPMLLMIGWRGEPGVKDEPQHVKQGRINEQMLSALEIPYAILSSELIKAKEQVDNAFEYMEANSAPYALLVRKDSFEPYRIQKKQDSPIYPMNREEAVQVILPFLPVNDILVSTTGKTSREVFEFRAGKNQQHDKDFLTVGCMGHASQIALGIALEKPDRQMFCLDGDGAVIMHMGALALIGNKKPKNFKHILINNGSHDSVGGQATVGFHLDFEKIVLGCGYRQYFKAESADSLKEVMKLFINTDGPVFLEVRTKSGARENLGRPTIKPVDNKKDFMVNLSK